MLYRSNSLDTYCMLEVAAVSALFYLNSINVAHFHWFFLLDVSVSQPGYSIRTFMGHSASVMSLDFHPTKDDLVCSCDGDGEVRYWSINNGNCTRFFKVHN